MFEGFTKTALIHTKISAVNKAAIEQLAKTNGINENVVINTLLTLGLTGVKPAAKTTVKVVKKAKKKTKK